MNGPRNPGEPLADLEASLVEVEQVPKVQKIERRMNRRNQVSVVLCAMLALFAVAFSGWNAFGIATMATKTTVNEKAISDIREANKLRKDAGLPEIPIPEPGEDVDMASVADAASALALDSIREDPRFRGPRGPSGPSGEPCKPSVPGCTGQEGSDGQDGSEGQPGPPGVTPRISADAIYSQVSKYCSDFPENCAPKGPKGDVGPRGPAGPPGPQGEPGADGVSIQSVVCIGPDLVFYSSNGGELGRINAPLVCIVG